MNKYRVTIKNRPSFVVEAKSFKISEGFVEFYGDDKAPTHVYFNVEAVEPEKAEDAYVVIQPSDLAKEDE